MKKKYIIFSMGKRRYGIPLEHVIHAYPVVEFIPVPKFPEEILGVVNILGELIPVLDIRKNLNLPISRIKLSDQLLKIKINNISALILVETVVNILTYTLSDQNMNDDTSKEVIQSMVKDNHDIIFILNIQRLISSSVLNAIQELPLKRSCIS